MTMPAYRYGDPAKVLEREEEQSCKGCMHLDLLWGDLICRLGVDQGKKIMRRCTRYNEKEGGNG